MKKSKKLEAHLFICTQVRGDGSPSCGEHGGIELRDIIKANCKKKLSKSRIRVNSSGCLGYCKEGLTAVLYPGGKWFTNLTIEDASTLEEAVEKKVQSKAKKTK